MTDDLVADARAMAARFRDGKENRLERIVDMFLALTSAVGEINDLLRAENAALVEALRPFVAYGYSNVDRIVLQPKDFRRARELVEAHDAR